MPETWVFKKVSVCEMPIFRIEKEGFSLFMQLQLDYHLLRKPRAILLTTALVVGCYNALFYFHPANLGWWHTAEFSWLNLFRFLVLEQFLMEIITMTVLFWLIRRYADWRQLIAIDLHPLAFLKYLAQFLPVFLLAFVFFNPLTQSARYLLNEYQNYSWPVYFNEYLLNLQLYLVYLIPVFLGGYGILITNLISLHNRQLAATSRDMVRIQEKQAKQYPNRLMARDDFGEVPVLMSSVMWFEKEGRKYFAHSLRGKLRTRETLSELESSIDPSKFVRVNRAVLINIDYIQNYSFWENDKYILRLRDKDQTEFVMSRERLNKIKSRFEK